MYLRKIRPTAAAGAFLLGSVTSAAFLGAILAFAGRSIGEAVPVLRVAPPIILAAIGLLYVVAGLRGRAIGVPALRKKV
jgi:cytochrome c biogenesis protein CcdA